MGENKQQAHRALYRKYRPKSLGEIIGQEHITTILGNAVKQKKINHAYLFTGPRGTGKTSIARILAYEINELDYTDDTQQLDIIEIDAASNRRIDDIRELREKVHIAPVSSAYKVYIIDEVHMLTTESFNALLKTLEEPPSHVIFILATTELHKLPATILSRVQRHSFRLIDIKRIVEHLAVIAKQEGIDIDTDALELLAKHGGGSFRDSISLLDQLSAHGDHIDKAHIQQLLGVAPQELVIELLNSVEIGQHSEILKIVESFITKGLTPTGIATELIDYMRSAIYNNQAKPYFIDLMEQLLAVSSAPYKQLKLESILLQVNNTSAGDQQTPAPKSTVVAQNVTQAIRSEVPQKKAVAPAKKSALKKADASPKPSKPELETTPTAAAAATPEQTSDEAQDIINSWQIILDAIKIKHNPLYTLLRVSTPSVSGQTLSLAFSFGFHKKKLEDPKYKALLAETITEIANQSVEIESIVDKNKAEATTKTSEEDPAHASQISAVRDMMGGGDIINV